MSLQLFDTSTREVRTFVPLQAGHVGMYLCGPTVQSAPHVGHLRSAIALDVLQRWLEWNGNSVTVVRNITDIDDKILQKAQEAGREWWAHARIFERAFEQAYTAVGVLPPAAEPRATGHIPDMVELISTLIDHGHAYEKQGSVYFDVRSYAEYGSLTAQLLDDLTPAADSPNDDKRDPRDFALWKARKDDEPETASWDSPWGRGRPGWHIECSAMARRYLGDSFDIHGGGLDLRFPHHENEQAQSRAAGYGFAQLWFHSAWVTQSGVKMSKSLGNDLSVAKVLDAYGPAPLRLALAQVHYRSMLEYSDATLDDATAAWSRISGFVERASERVGWATAQQIQQAELPEAFVEAMDDDLAVPRAMAVIHENIRLGNTALTDGREQDAATQVLVVRAMLGILGLDPGSDLWQSAAGQDSTALEALDALVRGQLDQRTAAREAKDWAAADEIRNRLTTAGIVIEDSTEGARWSLATEKE